MFELTPFRTNSISRFDPFREIEEMEKRLFSHSAMPHFEMDLRDTGESFVLEADLPGIKKEDIQIDIEDDRLTISAQRNSNSEETDKDGQYIRRERYSGSLTRSFDVSSIRTADITAAYDNGVLTLTLPKKTVEVPTSRRLEIQ